MNRKGVVINLNAFGAAVRLDTGELARASSDDVARHRAEYERSLRARVPMAFVSSEDKRRATVRAAPQISDEHLDEQIASYLKSTQEWEGEIPAHERHSMRKKRRAAHWETT
ncbi:MAG: hypothetical protein ACREMP_09550 [Candidatus Tyrphobacter sp.]